MNDVLDRKRGTMLGLAVGDALGAAVEFQRPGTFLEVVRYRGGGPHGLAPGEWTDDTSMALALADSIAEVGWDINDQAERYVKWWRIGAYSVNGRCFDIGNTTIAALHRFQSSGDARTSGDRSEWASGNGSIMRLAAVPIRYHYMFPNGIGDLVERAVESSRALIEKSRQQVARTVNAALVGLHWSIGRRIRDDLLQNKRAGYGEEIVSALSARRPGDSALPGKAPRRESPWLDRSNQGSRCHRSTASTSATKRPASPLRKDDTTLNTASLKPPMFRISSPSGALWRSTRNHVAEKPWKRLKSSRIDAWPSRFLDSP